MTALANCCMYILIIRCEKNTIFLVSWIDEIHFCEEFTHVYIRTWVYVNIPGEV